VCGAVEGLVLCEAAVVLLAPVALLVVLGEEIGEGQAA
jgi:hypothetical protein